MNIFESILIAFDSIRVNKLRAALTLLSISIGVFAIIVAMGLVSSINETVTKQMADLGENTFSIFRVPKIRLGENAWRMYRNRKAINYRQVVEFKKQISGAMAVSANSTSSGHTVKYFDKETNPDVNLIGTDADYFITNSLNVSEGRVFSESDIVNNLNVVIIGSDIAKLLFPNQSPIGKDVIIERQKFTVVGLLEEKGAVLGNNQDNIVIIPLTQFLKFYSDWWEESLTVNVRAIDKASLSPLMDEAIGILRSIRDVQPWEINSFELETNETLTTQFESTTGFLSIFGIISGIIALLAAGVGIMNIMLVTIKERTREIGIRKALGAKKRWILTQFITETITLSQIGGFIGISMGLILSSLFGKALGLTISIPVDWIIYSILICTFLGIIFGVYPAWKAARLDPIEALRYE